MNWVRQVRGVPQGRRRRLLVALVVAVVCSATIYADYRESFRKGVLAARRGQWPAVVAAMREAIAEAPRDTDERINIAGFGDIVSYTPYYYLGLGLYNTKDCFGALDAWRQSEAQGGLQRVSGGARNEVARLRKECVARIAKNAPPKPLDKPAGPDPAAVAAAVQTAEAAIARAQQSERAVSQLAGDDLLSKVWRSEAALGPAESGARDTLTQARAALDSGRRDNDLARLQEAANLAGTAAERFDAIRATAGTRRAELVPPPIKEEPRPTPPSVPRPPTPTPPPVNATPATATEDKPAPPFNPPRDLAAAARLVFSARYQEAVNSLGRLRYTSGPAAGHAELLRAAALYSLYLIGGERDRALIDQAQQALAEMRRVTPDLRPDPRAFSPRFVQFFRRSLSGGSR